MKEVINYALSFIIITILMGACDKNNPEFIPNKNETNAQPDKEEPTPPNEEEPVPPPAEDKLDKVTNIQVNTTDNNGKRTVNINFEYDDKDRLIKIKNINQQTIEYVYNENSIDIKLSQTNNSNAYYLFKCSLLENNNNVQNMTYSTHGYGDNISNGSYKITYNTETYMTEYVYQGLYQPKKYLYIWNKDGNCINIKTEGINPIRFKSTNIENISNIDLNSFLGSFPNNRDLQMLAIIKRVGTPCKNIIVGTDNDVVETKFDKKKRIISFTKKRIRNNTTTEYLISYSESEQ